MKDKYSLGRSIRLLAGIVYGSLVVSEALAYVFLVGAAFLRLVDNFYFENFLTFVSVAVLGFLPFIFGLVVISLVYTLVIGFAQMIDDTRDMRDHMLGQNGVPSAAVQKPVVQAAPVRKKSAEAVVVRQPPKAYETVSLDTENGMIFCPHCGKSTFLDEEDRCEYCGREVHVKVAERKKAPLSTLTLDDEPREADCPPDKWYCKGCGSYVADTEKRCECGYKRS